MSFILLVEQAAPETPSANQVVLYPKADGLVYSKDDAGTERAIAGSLLLTLATEQASTSGTSIDFTSIPAGTKRITVMFVGVSTNGTTNVLIQIGDSGGVEATGYLSASAVLSGTSNSSSSTAGFLLHMGGSAATVRHGSVTLSLEDSSDFTWVASGVVNQSDSITVTITAGSKSLSAELDRVRITTVNGTDTFDAGAINISYE